MENFIQHPLTFIPLRLLLQPPTFKCHANHNIRSSLQSTDDEMCGANELFQTIFFSLMIIGLNLSKAKVQCVHRHMTQVTVRSTSFSIKLLYKEFHDQ